MNVSSPAAGVGASSSFEESVGLKISHGASPGGNMLRQRGPSNPPPSELRFSAGFTNFGPHLFSTDSPPPSEPPQYQPSPPPSHHGHVEAASSLEFPTSMEPEKESKLMRGATRVFLPTQQTPTELRQYSPNELQRGTLELVFR